MKLMICLSVIILFFCIYMKAAERTEISCLTTKESSHLLIQEKQKKAPEKKILYTVEEIRKRCPIIVGNKTFMAEDLVKMTDGQKEWFLDHAEPDTICHLCRCHMRDVLGSDDIAFLKKMPQEYTQDFQVKTPKYENYCATAACVSGILCFIGFWTSSIVACTCGKACCKANLLGEHAMYAMMGFGSAAICAPACGIVGECCCDKHCTRTYTFDDEEKSEEEKKS